MRRSTISNNSATGDGGGVQADNGDGKLELINTTLSGNVAAGVGGGISFIGSAGELSSVTIHDNAADEGGGVRAVATVAITLRNTVIAGNLATSSGNDCEDNGSGAWNSDDYNLIGDVDDCSFSAIAGTNDQLGSGAAGTVIDPMLSTLGNFGGRTETHAIVVGSPLIDAGNPSGCTHGVVLLRSDQRGRGFPREKDGDGDGTSICDIGAFEF